MLLPVARPLTIETTPLKPSTMLSVQLGTVHSSMHSSRLRYTNQLLQVTGPR
jgi:hypothetical protein